MRITQTGYELTADFDQFPTQHSSNIEVDFERDKTYSEYIISAFYGLVVNGNCEQFAPLSVDNEKIILPQKAFSKSGYLAISIVFYKDGVVERTNQKTFRIRSNIGSNDILPEDDNVWQDVVISVMNQYIDSKITPQLQELIDKAKALQKTNEELHRIIQEEMLECEALEELINNAEILRVESEKNRIENETIRVQDEDIRLQNENDRIKKETTRTTSEDFRLENEKKRIESENTRIVNEKNRVDETLELTTEARNQQITSLSQQKVITTQQQLIDDTVNRVEQKFQNGDFVPNHKWENTTLHFTNPDGSWDDGFDVGKVPNIMDNIYPIGCVYLTVVNTNPSVLFGGTWVRVSKGKTLVGVDENDPDFNTPKKEGGVKSFDNTHSHTIAHTHTINGHTHSTNAVSLTVAQMPSHIHNIVERFHDSNVYSFTASGASGFYGSSLLTKTTAATGSGQAHSHGDTSSVGLISNAPTNNSSSNAQSTQSLLQPFFAVYIWTRTA